MKQLHNWKYTKMKRMLKKNNKGHIRVVWQANDEKNENT